MEIQTIIVDNFYNDVDLVREFALQQDFNVNGNYPGHRTPSLTNDTVREVIQNIVRTAGGKITWWDTDQYNGAFQYTTATDRSWIHADQTSNWAAVCYLTPNAPSTAGTGLFRHKETGLYRAPKNPDGSLDMDFLNRINQDSLDMTKWERIDTIANKYNRLVLYRGDIFHMSLDYFGKDKYDGRLFQTFFFNTEY